MAEHIAKLWSGSLFWVLFFCCLFVCRTSLAPYHTFLAHAAHFWDLGGSLHCTTLHCTAPHFTARHGMARHGTARHGTTLHCTALHSTILNCTALHCTAQHYTELHYTTPAYITRHCTALYFTAPQGLHATVLPTRPVCSATYSATSPTTSPTHSPPSVLFLPVTYKREGISASRRDI